MYNKTSRLKVELDNAVKEGILIFKDGKRSTPEEVAHQQWADDKTAYLPDFIVKDEEGKVKEIWYGEEQKMFLQDS